MRFDERANGYARGEGICVMALKSLEDALRDGDTIRAVVRGTCTNQDGKIYRNFCRHPKMTILQGEHRESRSLI